MTRIATRCWFYLLYLITGVSSSALAAPAKLVLDQNWSIQSSCQTSAKGAQISSTGFHSTRWHRAVVPTTVLAALVKDKIYPDPYFADNLRSIPGTSYPIGRNFAHLPMPDDSPFRCTWWHRTEFVVPADFTGRNIWLTFNGINYRANIWLNGKKIADAAQTAGAFRAFEFEVHKAVRPGELNALAVEVFAPEPGDLALNWVDWSPTPPDKNMGIWRDVSLSATGPVSLRHPFAKTTVSPSLDSASVLLSVQVRNTTSRPVKGTLRAALDNIGIHQSVELAPQETKLVTFTPEAFPQLTLTNPRLWWPYQMGAQNLYAAHLRFDIANGVSDQADVRFGIREVTSELTETGSRLFRVNGRKLLVRGGGWAPDMLWRQSKQRLRHQFRYIQHLHLNTVRLEGKIESDDFFNLADEMGILVMAGWCCCDLWEKWDLWQHDTHTIATESLRSQLLRLRTHPSLLVWLYGSDNPPPADVEKEYLQVIEETEWPNPAISSASARPTEITGPSGVKMTGPYDYVPPSYWSTETARTIKFGGAFGFNTETSPGPAIPVMGSLRKMLPAGHIALGDNVLNFHAGGGKFTTTKIYDDAMSAIYGPPTNLEDYLRKSQAMAYDGERAMFEAYGRNKYTSTGVIQWMLNNPWPSIIWHLYDYYLQPAGGYFGARKANEPLHVQYSYDDRSVVVVNHEYQAFAGLKVSAEVLDVDLNRQFSQQAQIDVSADGSTTVFSIPETAVSGTPLSFVRLSLQDAGGHTVSSNFYWLPAKAPTFDWEKSTYVSTPLLSYEDLTALNRLAPVKLEVAAERHVTRDDDTIRVRVTNPSKQLAFQVCLQVTRKSDGGEILPVLWDDNYFSLMPGESAVVAAIFDPSQLQHAEPEVLVGGWNITPLTAPIVPAHATDIKRPLRR